MTRRRRVPKVLWKLFGHRAQTLGEALASLLLPSSPPPPPSGSPRHAQEEQDSHSCTSSLISMPDDPHDYKSLLSLSFVVVEEPPPLSPFSSSSSSSHSSHPMPHPHLIIERVMRLLSLTPSSSSNVLWTDYHGGSSTPSNLILQLLSSSPWTLLLHRIGENCMVYLLLHCSIFIPRRGHTYHQISGSRLTTMVFANIATQKSPHNISPQLPPLKRKPVSEKDASNVCENEEGEKYTEVVVVDGDDGGDVQRPKKRSRPFKRQRRSRKRGRLDLLQEADILEPRTGMCSSSSNGGSGVGDVEVCCSCCLKLEEFIINDDASKWAENERKTIFYSTEDCSSALPKKHLLNTLRSNNGGAAALVDEIFGCRNSNTEVKDCSSVYTNNCSHRISSSFCLYHSLLKLFKVMIGRARSCRHSRLLNKHCCEPSFSAPEIGSRVSGGREEDKSPLYCSNHQVVSFIWAACRSIIPAELLGGTCSNWRKLTKNISKYVRLRRFEKFPMKRCMHKMKAWWFSSSVNQHHSWCWGGRGGRRSGSHARLRHKLTTKWVAWLFYSLIPALLRSNFYITESQQGCKNVYYYRKDVWRKSTEGAMEELRERMYISVDSDKVVEMMGRKKDKTFQYSKLRFCPKEGGLRPLTNLRSMSISTKKNGSWFRPRKRAFSANNWIRGFHAVLTRLRQKGSSKLGCSVFDYNEVYKKMHPFIVEARRGARGVVDMFLVVADVTKAFDSIDQDRLLDIMEEVIPEGDCSFGVEKKIFFRNGCFFVKDHHYFHDRDHEMQPSSRGPECVVVDHGRRRSMNKQEIISGLKEHVKWNVVQFGDWRGFHIQNVGIPQGSIASPLLCSFYYGRVENAVIRPYLERRHGTGAPPKYVLMRFVDDFLLLSTSKPQAESFLGRMRRGFRAYNCRMNDSKFSTNFAADPPERAFSPPRPPRVFVDGEGERFHKWSGLLINARTLEIRADYTRYMRTHLSSTLTVWPRGRALGGDVRRRLYSFLGPKCHPLFLDSTMNSAKAVMLNVYQCFLLSAMKLHCYVRSLSGTGVVRAGPVFEAVRRSLGYMYKLMKRRMFCVGSATGIRPLLTLEKGQVLWLGLKAYVSALTRKQSCHKELILRLRRALARSSARLCISPDLEYATAASNSSLLWKIRY